MEAEVTASGSVILVDVRRPETCCLTLEVNEAVDLAKRLLAAAVDARKLPEFDPELVRPR